MRVRLAYGKTGLDVDLPQGADVTVVEPTYLPGVESPARQVRDALRHPIGSRPVRTLASERDRVGIVFSDITRPAPNQLLVGALLEELAHVPADNVTLFNATGTHRPNTEAELREMLGDTIVDRYAIEQNDAHDRSSHALVGTTSTGNDIWLHRSFVACNVKILTGFIEPHFFAGFSGGGKAVMPGLALLETVTRNHGAQHLDHPAASWGVREGNPLWEEIHEAAGMVAPTFLLNVALNREKEVTGVYAGQWEEAHALGCDAVRETAMAPVRHAFDVVITSNSGYPLDLNLYQAVKGMSAAAQVVRPGGSIIVVADCWDGIPEHGSYGQILSEADSVSSLLASVRDPDDERQDRWQAHVQARVIEKADVYVYSDNLTDRQIEDALLRPCRSVEEEVSRLLEQVGSEATLCVLPEGPQTVPYVWDGGSPDVC